MTFPQYVVVLLLEKCSVPDVESICYCSGTQIYALNGTDPEGQEVRYGVAFEPGSKEFFRVDPKSGNITLVEPLDREVTDDGKQKVSFFYLNLKSHFITVVSSAIIQQWLTVG